MTKQPVRRRLPGSPDPPRPAPTPNRPPSWAEIPLSQQRHLVAVLCELILARLRLRGVEPEASDEPCVH